MPVLCGYSWPDALDGVIVDRSRAYGVPLDLSLAIIAVESGFDPLACGDRVYTWDHIYTASDGHRGAVVLDPRSPVGFYVAWECGRSPNTFGYSHGLLQLHTGGGQGSGMLWSQLVDPTQILNRGLPNIRAAFASCWSPTIPPYDYIWCVATQSGHPGQVPRDDARIKRLYDVWVCMFEALTGTPGGGGGGGGDAAAGTLMKILGCASVLLTFPVILPLGYLRRRFASRPAPLPGG